MTTKLEKVRHKADKDFYFFAKDVMGFSKMTPQPHRELCRHLTKPSSKEKKLTLMPRGSFKSSVGTVAHATHTIVQNPDVRILIVSETQKNARKYVDEIKNHFEKNQRLKALYGNFVSKQKWTPDEFVVSKRIKVKKEPTVTAGSLERGMLTGMHFDQIYLDDVVSLNNINTPDQIRKTLNYYRMLQSILDPGGKIFINGTRYSVADLYGHILEEEKSQFDVLVKSACEIDGNGEIKPGSLLMPKVLTKEFLEKQRDTQGQYIFNCQYQNLPISDELQTFKQDYIQYYDKNPPGLIYFMTVDPALSGGYKSDSTGICVVGVDYFSNWYVQEALEVKLDLNEVIDLIFRLAERYPMQCVGMQKFILEKAIMHTLNYEMEKRNFVFPVKELATDNRRSKETRIKGLQPKFEAKEIFIKKEHIELEYQIAHFPQLKHDDVLDALQMQLQITYPSDKKPESSKDPKIEALTPLERKEWEHVKSLGVRKIKRKKWINI